MTRVIIARGLAGLLSLALPVLADQETLATAELAPVGDVILEVEQGAAGSALLDVGLVIFDPGIPADASSHSKLGIFPEIRRAEAQFIPVFLRQVMQAANAWAVVRVLPEPEQSSELLLTGRILHSDGLRLSLQIRVQDATGRVWLDKGYLDEAVAQDYPVAEGADPYADLYRQIANDLLATRRSLDARQLQTIRQVGLMRYAAGLSQAAFGSYLSQTAEGLYSLLRLPAQNDPMMARVERIRNQQHLFIDTVDEQYLNLYDEMAPTYHLWRQFSREQAIYRQEYQARAASRDKYGRRGTFIAMERTYNTYKGVKIQQQDLEEMALGFNNEVAPTVMEVSGKLVRLSGTLATQYSDWRAILRDIFSLETGLPAGP